MSNGKFHKLSLTTPHNRYAISFEIIHADILGPSLVISINDMCYFLLNVDDYIRYKCLYVMNNKGQVSQLFHHFHAMVLRKFNSQIKQLHKDRGAEFKSLEHFLFQRGYLRRISCPYTPL